MNKLSFLFGIGLFLFPLFSSHDVILEIKSFRHNMLSYIIVNIAQMVRNFREPLLLLLESGNIDLCFANEDEAAELLR